MQLHHLQALHPGRRARRIGRGGKRGTTAGRGTKGQRARAGAKIRPALRDYLKKLPKLRGRGKHSFRSFRQQPAVLDLGVVSRRFTLGGIVDPAALLKSGLIRTIKGRLPRVKILSGRVAAKKLTFRGVTFSRSARKAVEAAGGTIY